MDILRHLTTDRGFFTRQDALEAGYADRDLTKSVRNSITVRFRRGYYAFTDEWRRLSQVERHRVRSNAVLHSLGPAVALSHVSGVIRHGIDVWGVNLNRVHVTRLDGAPGRIEGDVVHHEGMATADDLAEIGDQRVLRAERCVLEAASRANNEVALCLLDAGLRAEAFGYDELRRQHEIQQWWPFMRHLHIPVRMADGRSGSIGESRGRWLFKELRLPVPELQHEVRHPNGELAGITDWWWREHGLMGEFDGRIKYGRLLRPGQDPGGAVFDEKQREDLLRELTGDRMIRLTWDDYRDRATTAVRLRRALRIAA